jgi:hypothetical protein
VYQRCPAIAAAAADATGTDPEGFLTATADQLSSCDCSLDIKALQALLWATFFVEPRTAVAVTLSAAGKQVLGSPTDSWERTAKSVLAAAKNGGSLRLSDGRETKSPMTIRRLSTGSVAPRHGPRVRHLP